MNTYLLALALLFAFTAGHALAVGYYTRGWFYRYAFPLFAISSLVVAGVIVWK